MSAKPAQAFGISISDLSQGEALAFSKLPGFYIFSNAMSWVAFYENQSLRRVFQNARAVFADGVGTLWAAKIQGFKIHYRNPGPDFTDRALREWSHEPMGFIGGTPEGLEILKKKYALTNVIQYIPPFRPFSTQNAEEDFAAFEKMTLKEAVRPSIIWVLLGCPKQEFWADAVFSKYPDRRFYAVGAAFDFLTDQKLRAPLWMRKIGLEWLFRLFSEPERLWRRYLVGNFKLIAYALLCRFKEKSHD